MRSIAVLVADVEGRVRYANARAETFFGSDPDRLLGRPLESLPLGEPVRARLQRESGPWEEQTVVEVGGRTVPVRVSRRAIPADGSPVGSMVLVTDVTEIDTAIVERDRARESDRAKTRSLHMVAHDLAGPMTVLNGYVSLVLDGSLRPEQLEPYFPMLGGQLEHMQRLVNSLLDTARLEEGHLELRLERLDLVTFVERLLSAMRAPETRHRVLVRREIAALPVLADPIRLDSIVRNVVSNAIKYSEEGTVVTCTLRAAGRDATLEVADQGRGIHPDDLSTLFTRFGRVGDLSTNATGVGLGLYLSRELARLHGGDLDVASRFGQGARFTLRLPLCNREP